MKSSPQKIYFSRQNCQNSKSIKSKWIHESHITKVVFSLCLTIKSALASLSESSTSTLPMLICWLKLDIVLSYCKLFIYFYFFGWNRIKIDYVLSSKWHYLCKTNLGKWSECLPFFIIIARICRSVTLMYSFLKITVPNRTFTFVMRL